MRRGFTLLELMVAMAIATIIGAAAVGAGMLLNRVMVDTRKRAVLWDEAKRLEEAMLSQLQEAGGDPLRPHEAILVENNCGARDGMPSCDGADRITITRSRIGLPPCKVSGTSGANLDVDAVSGVCCLFMAADGSPLATSPWEQRAALLLRADGTLVSLNLHNATNGTCKVNAPPGQGNPNPKLLSAGTLVAVEAVTIYPSPQGSTGEYQLVQWIDGPIGGVVGNGTVDPSEILLIADHVYDFQVALGYDGNPENGESIDVASTSDEWLGNAAGDALNPVISLDQLRMIGIGIAVGVPSGRTIGAQLLDGPVRTRPGIYMATTRGSVMMRNLNIALP
ncbi:MAG: prepilin-type N-terminal cleavage/methylation domain-containing protein [Deltaproteobacteria bacterium]|nr:prepilin-type N-terminal cleavage/methylation domain-containing protein [Deltaproteobacteria bacterium]